MINKSQYLIIMTGIHILHFYIQKVKKWIQTTESILKSCFLQAMEVSASTPAKLRRSGNCVPHKPFSACSDSDCALRWASMKVISRRKEGEMVPHCLASRSRAEVREREWLSSRSSSAPVCLFMVSFGETWQCCSSSTFQPSEWRASISSPHLSDLEYLALRLFPWACSGSLLSTPHHRQKQLQLSFLEHRRCVLLPFLQFIANTGKWGRHIVINGTEDGVSSARPPAPSLP